VRHLAPAILRNRKRRVTRRFGFEEIVQTLEQALGIPRAERGSVVDRKRNSLDAFVVQHSLKRIDAARSKNKKPEATSNEEVGFRCSTDEARTKPWTLDRCAAVN
jgi:hypothetical protein